MAIAKGDKIRQFFTIYGGFPKTSVLGKQPGNSQFCKAEGLKNRKRLSQNRAR
jgi:hypothetical protein